jgi:hypothetical protein
MMWLDTDFGLAIKKLKEGDDKFDEPFVKRTKHSLREWIFEFYREAYRESEEAQSYVRSRGWDDQNYRFGYAPSGDYLQNQCGIDSEKLKKVYLLSQSGSDFFNERIIFPIRDIHGEIAHFQGRSIEGSSIPWLSTKGNPSINHYLFNGEKLKTIFRDEQFLFICEGIGDAMALQSIGLPSLGIMGNQMPIKEYKSLLQDYEAICFLLDNDKYELGTEEEGRYKSWTRMLPHIIQLQQVINSPVYCLSPPDLSGVKDVNEYLDHIEYDTVEFWSYLSNNVQTLSEASLEVFNRNDSNDLYWLVQSQKSAPSQDREKVKSRIESAYEDWLRFLEEVL